ncbi:MAG: TolC family protein [Candidatus Omnitrophota bacterium]
MKRLGIFWLIHLIYLSLFFLNAEDQPLKLSTLINEAVSRNPKIKTAEHESLAYSHRIKPAHTLPDPMIELGIQNMGLNRWMIGKDPNSGIAFSFSQLFPLFGKLKLSGEMAQKAYEGRLQALEAAKRDIIRDIKTTYADLFYVYQSIETLEKQKNLMQKTLSITETRYTVGSGTQNDIFKAQSEISRMDEMIIPMREMIKMKEKTLNLLRDFPTDRPLGKPESLEIETIPVSLEQLEGDLRRQSPRIKEAQAMEDEQSLMVRYSRKELIPDINVRAGYEYKGKMTGMVELMLGAQIPLYAGRRQTQRLLEAQAAATSAAWETRSMQNEMLMALNDHFLKAKTAENMIRLYKTRILPQARLSTESSFAAYPTNKADFMSLINDISTQFSAERAYFRELTELWKALATIESLTTVPLLSPKE